MITPLLRKNTVKEEKKASPSNQTLSPSHTWQLSFPSHKHSELSRPCRSCTFLPNFCCKFPSIFSLPKSYLPPLEFYWHWKWMKNLSKDFGMWLRYYMSLHVCLFIFKCYYLCPLEVREREKKRGCTIGYFNKTTMICIAADNCLHSPALRSARWWIWNS